MILKTRLAPTPSGYLHIGNGLSFLLTWLIARKWAGKVHLRIDDIDSDRVRPEYVQDIFDTLHWLGLDWDTQTYSQIPQIPLYRTYIERLAGLYPCNCSRKAIQAHSANGIYPQTCLPNLPALNPLQGENNIRLYVPDTATVVLHEAGKADSILKPAELVGDLVVWRKNDTPAYQLASVVDDLMQGINFIVRGEDLWRSTVFQLYVASALGEKDFANITFLHHALVLDAEGNKLSKSAGAVSMRALREQNALPTVVYRRFADFWGMQDVSETPTLQELFDKFSW